jgi:hypothetical protein
MRIFIYGYDTQMERSTSVANLDDLANEFQGRIKSIRSDQRVKTCGSSASPKRPLILLGHSLGGIIIKAVCLYPHCRMLWINIMVDVDSDVRWR